MADSVFVTTAGLGIITNRIKGAGTEPVHMHWGTGGATAAATTDVALVTPATELRVTSTTIRSTSVYPNDVYQAQGTLTAGTSKTVDEVSLHDDASTGEMYLRGTFTGIALNVADSIQFTINTQFIST